MEQIQALLQGMHPGAEFESIRIEPTADQDNKGPELDPEQVRLREAVAAELKARKESKWDDQPATDAEWRDASESALRALARDEQLWAEVERLTKPKTYEGMRIAVAVCLLPYLQRLREADASGKPWEPETDLRAALIDVLDAALTAAWHTELNNGDVPPACVTGGNGLRCMFQVLKDGKLRGELPVRQRLVEHMRGLMGVEWTRRWEERHLDPAALVVRASNKQE